MVGGRSVQVSLILTTMGAGTLLLSLGCAVLIARWVSVSGGASLGTGIAIPVGFVGIIVLALWLNAIMRVRKTGRYELGRGVHGAPILVSRYLLAAGLESVALLAALTLYTGYSTAGETVLALLAFTPFLLLYPLYHTELGDRSGRAVVALLLLWGGVVTSFAIIFAIFAIANLPKQGSFAEELFLSAGRLSEQDAWHELPGTADTSHFLVLSASHRSVGSLTATAESAGLKVSAVELRPFALARAVNQPDAICAWTATDGCDAVVIRDWTPVTYQSAYWGAGSALDSVDLANRIVEVVESTIIAHDMQNPDISVPSDIPIFVTGSPVEGDPAIAQRVAGAMRRPLGDFDIPLELPPDFPVHDLIVNLGLTLWAA